MHGWGKIAKIRELQTNAKNYDPKNVFTEESTDREFVSLRMFAAPRELVFRAFTDPDHLKHWCGPKGFTNTFHEFDPRPGGVWRFVMHGPDGKDYQNKHIFAEIVKPERIVLQHVSGPQFQLTGTLAEVAGKTRLTWHMLFESAEECAKVETFAVEANEQNFDRLAAQLAIIATERPFVITRLLDAPRDLVWKAWTDREHMQWWGPKASRFITRNSISDPGGIFHYCMRTADCHDMCKRKRVKGFVLFSA